MASNEQREPVTPTVGLALGSGSSRGWSHIGIIRALQERGIRPSVVAGASIGSLVGGAYASGQLDDLEAWARELGRVDVWRLLDTTLRGGGVMTGNRLMGALAEVLEDHDIEDLPMPFAAVATELDTGVEVWLREDSMLDAIRASSGLPGLFTPVWHKGRWLIDGGVVNPVPVSLCRALGADYVIAVSLNKRLKTYAARWRRPDSDEPSEKESHGPRGGEASEPPEEPPPPDQPEDADAPHGEEEPSRLARLEERWSGLVDGLVESWKKARRRDPGVFDVVGTSISIMQDRITRSRMVGDPPEIILEPDMGHFELMDFHRAEEAMELGRAAVERETEHLEELKGMLER
jgi:NTE family protein